jgi:type VI secretion system protein ImpL
MTVYLQHTEGSKKGQIESFDLDRIRIGRLPDNDLCFNPEADLAVSGHHAEISCEGANASVRDLQSRNGTYVNSRRIDQPTPLSDGDTIQFAAGGPKVVFSRRDPSGGTAAVARGTIARPGEAVPRPEVRKPPAGPSRLRLLAMAGVALAVLAALGIALWWSWRAFLVVLLIALVALGGGLLARWWVRRRPAAAAPRGAPEARAPLAADLPGDAAHLQGLRKKWADALAMLRKSNLKRGLDDPAYALPWYVVLGETGSGKTETIRSANPISWLSSSGERQAVTVTRSCDWWFFDDTVLLDTPGRYTFPAAQQVDEAEWREFLSLLKQSRPREPINGAIVALGADGLASRPVKKLQEEAGQLRRRLDDMLHQLGATFPVYVLVTKMDLLSGFTEFFRGLPDAIRGQAMGAANDDLGNRAGATAFFDRAFRTMSARLTQLRLARLDEEESPDVLRKLFLFPEEFRSLRAPLRAFTDALFRQNPYAETPLLRGLLFASARQGGVPFSPVARALGYPDRAADPVAPAGILFARDIFTVLLPQDRPLVGWSAVSHQRFERTQVAGFWATVALAGLVCLLLTVSFIRNARALSRLDVEPCLTAQGSTAERLTQLDGCRETIEGLTLRSFWGKAASDFGLNQTGRVQEPLRQRYLQVFLAAVLDPLDARIDRKLASLQEAPAYAGALVQRINWLARCRTKEGCPAADDSVRPTYRVMLAAEYPGLKDGDPRVEQLARTHDAYLRWQPDPRALEEMQGKQAERVKGWLRAGGLRADSILASARAQFPPVRAGDLWGVEMPLQVDAAYTRRAWAQGIQPLLAGLKTIAPEVKDVGDSLARFEMDYRNEGFRQWGQFLANFLQGERLAGGRGAGREMTARILGPDSPYRRVVDVTASNLSPLLGGAPQAEDVPAWAVTLQRYAELKAKAGEGQKGAKPAPEERKAKAEDRDREAVGYLTGYWEAVDQLRGEVSTPERAFRAAQKALEEGELSDAPTYHLQKALWNRERLRRAIGRPQGDDRVFWVLVARPVDFAWRAILDQAGVYLQQQWEALRPELTELPPGAKAGRVMSFVSGPAAPFLERRRDGYGLKALLGENLSFTRPFFDYLARARAVSPEDFGRLDPPRQIVASP